MTSQLASRSPSISVAGHEAVLQLHAEEAIVATRRTQGETVRVATETHMREHVVDVPLTREIIEVERVAIDQVVEVAPAIRYEGDVTILPVLEEVEVVVIERRLILKEEIHVRRRRITEMHRETIFLRAQTAVVTRFLGDEAGPVSLSEDVPSDTERSVIQP